MSSLLSQKLRNLKEGLSAFGVTHLFRLLSWRTPNWLFSFDHSFILSCEGIKLHPCKSDNFSIRLATPGDFKAMKEIGVREQVAKQRFSCGDKCALVVREGQFVSMCWAATGKLLVKAIGSVLDTGENAYYRYNAYTLLPERRKGLFNACCRLLQDHYEQEGKNRVINVISAFNLVSLSASKKMGFVIIGETYLLGFLGVTCCLYKKWPYKRRRVQFHLQRSPVSIRSI